MARLEIRHGSEQKYKLQIIIFFVNDIQHSEREPMSYSLSNETSMEYFQEHLFIDLYSIVKTFYIIISKL